MIAEDFGPVYTRGQKTREGAASAVRHRHVSVRSSCDAVAVDCCFRSVELDTPGGSEYTGGMAVGFELASNGWVPRGEFAEVPGGTPCRGCAALREELSRLRRTLGGELLAVDARPVAGAGAAGANRRPGRPRRCGSWSGRRRPAPREREAAVAGRGAGGRQRPAAPVDEAGSDSGAAARTGRPRGPRRRTAARRVRPWRSSRSGTELSAVRPGVRGERREDEGARRARARPRACETLAAAVPRLFPNTRYGVSVWALFAGRSTRTTGRCGRCRGCCRRTASMSRPAPWRTAPRFVPLFAPLVAAIAERQAAAHVAHGDETSWTIRRGDSPRCWRGCA